MENVFRKDKVVLILPKEMLGYFVQGTPHLGSLQVIPDWMKLLAIYNTLHQNLNLKKKIIKKKGVYFHC